MNWDRIAGAARQYWGRLTGDDAGMVAGLRRRTLGRIRSEHAVATRANEKRLAEWRERQHKIDPIHK